jgi:hypothetical protein
MGTHGFTSDPPASKFLASNTRGIFFGVGVADGFGGWLDGVGFGVETAAGDDEVPVAALVSSVQPAVSAHIAAPTTTDEITVHFANMARSMLVGRPEATLKRSKAPDEERRRQRIAGGRSSARTVSDPTWR